MPDECNSGSSTSPELFLPGIVTNFVTDFALAVPGEPFTGPYQPAADTPHSRSTNTTTAAATISTTTGSSTRSSSSPAACHSSSMLLLLLLPPPPPL